jgi:hypothetical protein
MSSSSSKVPSKKPISKKAATPVPGPFGLKYHPGVSVYREDYPRIIRSTDPGSPPGVYPPTLNTIPKSFEKQIEIQNESAENTQQEWHASAREQIIFRLLQLNPSALPSRAKLQEFSSTKLARWAISTLTYWVNCRNDFYCADNNGGFGDCSEEHCLIHIFQESNFGAVARETRKTER